VYISFVTSFSARMTCDTELVLLRSLWRLKNSTGSLTSQQYRVSEHNKFYLKCDLKQGLLFRTSHRYEMLSIKYGLTMQTCIKWHCFCILKSFNANERNLQFEGMKRWSRQGNTCLQPGSTPGRRTREPSIAVGIRNSTLDGVSGRSWPGRFTREKTPIPIREEDG